MTNEEFFLLAGYLASSHREVKIEAEVPQNQIGSFEYEYEQLTGLSNPQIRPIRGDKRSPQLRIYVSNYDNFPIIDGVNLKDTPSGSYIKRINNSSLVRRLFEYGFRTGEGQDLSEIRSMIPTQYLENFERGLRL